ncbi:MAG: thioredoxin family protein [Hyphomicrobiaceae bacterium]
MSISNAPRIVSRDAWLEARKALLVQEKAMTRQLDALRAERRAMPWVKIEKPYKFEGPDGTRTLADLFGGSSQLAVYHFMLTPGSDDICPGCSFISDHIDAARQHFEQADLAFAAISRAPLSRIEPVRQRMGWTFPWLSSHGADFNFDFGVSFRKGDIAAGRAIYNYGTPIRQSQDMHGTSIFAKDDAGAVYHTYSTYARGAELLDGAFMWLDLAPKGRNETNGIMSWVKLHDEYEKNESDGLTCCR